MQEKDGIYYFGPEPEEKVMEQARGVAEKAVHVALMADNHAGYIMPVGGVAAYKDKIPVSGVGFDIGCGNTAAKTDLHESILFHPNDFTPTDLANQIVKNLDFGMGRKNTQKARDYSQAGAQPISEHYLLGDHPWWESIPEPFREPLKKKAREQIGTIGSGNHYVNVYTDEQGYIWIGTHFGSRGLGHTIATGFLNLSQNKEWDARGPEVEGMLDTTTDLGQAYITAMRLAGYYAEIGRSWVIQHVVFGLLGCGIEDWVNNHHNYAWEERHFNQDLWVVRKGATPLFMGQRGFVGGSMGDHSYIIKGTKQAHEESLSSTIHGAGRVMSRSAAKGRRARINKATGEVSRPKQAGLVTREMMSAWVKDFGVVVRGGDVDESPHVYKRIDEVLAAQGDTVQVEHKLKPIISVMAGADVRDDYKD